MQLADLDPRPCVLGERGGEPVLLRTTRDELWRFDLQGRAIDGPTPLPLTLAWSQVFAGAGVALLTRPFRGAVVDLETGAVLESIEDIEPVAAISRRGARLAVSWGRPGASHSLGIRDVAAVGETGYPPPAPFDAEPIWIGDDSSSGAADWHVLCVLGRTILRYSYVDDEWAIVVEKRHGEGKVAVAPDASVIGCEGSKEVHFLRGDDGRLLSCGKRGAFAVGAGGRVALCGRKGVVRLMRGETETSVDLPAAPYWLAYSLDGAQLVWGDAERRLGVVEHP